MALLHCNSAAHPGSVRQPAVAGQFYPGNAGELRAEVRKYLDVKPTLKSPPVILISPHAGYVFSGPLAGRGFAEIDRAVNLVILIGPSHHAWFSGISIPDVDGFATPLATAPLAREEIAALRKSPIVNADFEPHAQEHSLEVQIPFLQVVLPKCRIIPIVMGKVDPAAVAELLLPLIGPKTLLVASSDFSHYHPHEEAQKIDRRSIATIMAGDAGGFIDACGEAPIRVAMRLASMLGLSPVLLDARNSYETAPPRYQDARRVVGYASIAYVKNASGGNEAGQRDAAKAAAAPAGPDINVPDAARQFLLKLARQSLEAAVRGQNAPRCADVPAFARDKYGCFVTLTIRGELRGCIGYLEGIKPLWEAVIDNARNAALSDHRFPPVRPEELSSIRVEVSVLSVPAPLPYRSPDDLLAKLVAGEDGLILQSGSRQSTYLPQVWEHFGGDKVKFLESLALKGGMPADGWKTANVKRYRAVHFAEP